MVRIGTPQVIDMYCHLGVIHEALEKLEAEDPRKAEIVMLRYFAGLTEEETANALGLSRRTVQLEWRIARAWLRPTLLMRP